MAWHNIMMEKTWFSSEESLSEAPLLHSGTLWRALGDILYPHSKPACLTCILFMWRPWLYYRALRRESVPLLRAYWCTYCSVSSWWDCNNSQCCALTHWSVFISPRVLKLPCKIAMTFSEASLWGCVVFFYLKEENGLGTSEHSTAVPQQFTITVNQVNSNFGGVKENCPE